MFSTVSGFTFVAVLIGLGVFIGALVALEVGQGIERRRVAKSSAEPPAGFGAMNGAVFALLGLLIAFTFSGAATRFEARRALVTQETNAIGTAYLRLGLLLPDARVHLQDEFRGYLEARLAAYRATSIAAFRAGQARAVDLQGTIWRDAVAASKEAGPPAIIVLLPAINEAIDITTTRSVALENHPPAAIFGMLIVLALLAALLAGTGLSSTEQNWMPKLAFAGAMAATIYVTLDIEYPRLGLIRISEADHILQELRQSMK